MLKRCQADNYDNSRASARQLHPRTSFARCHPSSRLGAPRPARRVGSNTIPSCHSFLVTSSVYQHEYTCIYRPLPSYHVHHVLSSESRHRPGQQFFGPWRCGHRSCNLTYWSVICATLTTAEATPTTAFSSSLPATSRIVPASNGCAHTWATAHTQGGKGVMGAPRVSYTQLLEPIQMSIRGRVCSVQHQWVV